LRFENKVVMVTGGAAGIGRVTAENFAREGARIAICDVNPEAGAAAIKALGAEASFEQVDVASTTAVSGWVEGVFDKYGQIDVLVDQRQS
jgi:NAD(P)-dependent dehydrogenase (short-subunit alcohol dehydrogenase family)